MEEESTVSEEDSKLEFEEGEDETLDKLDDLYTRRRVIQNGETFEAPIEDVEYVPKSTLTSLSRNEKIAFIVDIAGDKLAVLVDPPKHENTSNWNTFFEILDASSVSTPTFSFDDLIGETLPLQFNSDMTGATVEGKEIFLRVRPSDDVRFASEDSFDMNSKERIRGFEEEIRLYKQYENEVEDTWWKQKANINVEDEDTFTVSVSPTEEHTFEWTFDVPSPTESDADDTERLIEHVGGGTVSGIDNGIVYIAPYHKVYSSHRVIARSGDWCLMTRKDYKDYVETGFLKRIYSRMASLSVLYGALSILGLYLLITGSGVLKEIGPVLIVSGFLFMLMDVLLVSDSEPRR